MKIPRSIRKPRSEPMRGTIPPTIGMVERRERERRRRNAKSGRRIVV